MKIIPTCSELRMSSSATSLLVLQTIAVPCQLDDNAKIELTKQNFALEWRKNKKIKNNNFASPILMQN